MINDSFSKWPIVEVICHDVKTSFRESVTSQKRSLQNKFFGIKLIDSLRDNSKSASSKIDHFAKWLNSKSITSEKVHFENWPTSNYNFEKCHIERRATSETFISDDAYFAKWVISRNRSLQKKIISKIVNFENLTSWQSVFKSELLQKIINKKFLLILLFFC